MRFLNKNEKKTSTKTMEIIIKLELNYPEMFVICQNQFQMIKTETETKTATYKQNKTKNVSVYYRIKKQPKLHSQLYSTII